MQKRKARVGVVSLGHAVYWPQFDGLKEELSKKSGEFISYFSEDTEVFNVGFVDTVDSAFAIVQDCKKLDLDALFLIMSTYVTSAVAAPFAVYLDIPQILVGIQPLDKLDYEHTTTYMQLCNDDICAMPEVAGVYERLGKDMPYFIVAASSETAKIKSQVTLWEKALSAKAAFKYAKIGYLGHTYEGMYDMNTDPTMYTKAFGAHVKMLEMCELAQYVEDVKIGEVNDRIDLIEQMFDIREPSGDPLTDFVKRGDLEWSARLSCALDTLVEKNDLTALAYYYKGEGGNLYERIASNLIIGNTLLTSKGIPLAGEADLKTAASMLITNRVGGGASFAEIHPFDVHDDIVLIGHDGPHNINISDNKPIIRKLKKFHGKSGSGISVEFNIKAGPITLLSTSSDRNGNMKLVLAKGESMKGAIPQTGNTNTRCKFDMPVTDFLAKWCAAGPTHHLALGSGDNSEAIKLFAKISHINLEEIK